MRRNLALYPWFKFVQQLIFWQATWFLYFESVLSAAEAVLLYAVFDIATTMFEVPSGYMSDRIGRKLTLMLAAVASLSAMFFLIFGTGFAAFALASGLMGAASAFASGTDSSLLFESLRAEGRADDVEAAELTAWRFSFAALAISAVAGGLMALYAEVLPYVATALAASILLVLAALFREPPHAKRTSHNENLSDLRASLVQPTLGWLLALALLMYVFSHIPFVFGQPFIRETLSGLGYAGQAPLVSGVISSSMMLISVVVSLVAMQLRAALGLAGMLLLAFAMQVALTAALAVSDSVVVIALLLLRMVPDALSQSFIRARVQPLLKDGIRATYFSVQSLAGRLLFAATLSVSAAFASDQTVMPYDEMQIILAAYATAGVVLLLVLARTARRAGV